MPLQKRSPFRAGHWRAVSVACRCHLSWFTCVSISFPTPVAGANACHHLCYDGTDGGVDDNDDNDVNDDNDDDDDDGDYDNDYSDDDYSDDGCGDGDGATDDHDP